MAEPTQYIPSHPNSAEYAAAVIPSNTANFTSECRGLYIGGTGDVSLFFSDGTSVLFTAVPQGQILPVRARRVNLTGTTATNIVALF